MAAASSSLASVAAVAPLDLPRDPEYVWPSDLMLKAGMTMECAIQQFDGSARHLRGNKALAEGLLTSFRLFGSAQLTQTDAAIATPVTKGYYRTALTCWVFTFLFVCCCFCYSLVVVVVVLSLLLRHLVTLVFLCYLCLVFVSALFVPSVVDVCLFMF